MKANTIILAVDDDKAVRDLMAAILRTGGYAVLTAQDGEEALQIADEQVPDLVLTDYVMPGINGRKLAKLLRSKTSAPIVLISGSVEPEQDPALLAEVEAFVGKPFTPQHLLATVERLLAHRIESAVP